MAELLLPKHSRGHASHARFRHINDGEIIWASGIGEIPIGVDPLEIFYEQPWNDNFVADEGEQLILDIFYRAATAPTNLFLRLANSTPVETSTLASLTEVTGTGYAAISLGRNTTDFPTLALVGGDYKVSMLTKTFTAAGTWTTANYLYMATTSNNTGKLVSAIALGTPRTLVGTDTLAVDYSMTAS